MLSMKMGEDAVGAASEDAEGEDADGEDADGDEGCGSIHPSPTVAAGEDCPLAMSLE